MFESISADQLPEVSKSTTTQQSPLIVWTEITWMILKYMDRAIVETAMCEDLLVNI